jgi:polyisoprenyl-teichoic acid--peptidoglycan teichoic acid transferase
MASRPPTVLEEPTAATVPPVGSRRRRRTWIQRTILGVGVVVVLGIVAGIAAIGYGIFRFNQINKEKLSLSKVGAGEPQNYLIVGSDSRDSIDKSDPNYKAFGGSTGGQRSDTIIVMRVDPKSHTIDMLSLPRDLWVPIAGTGDSQRINTAYSLANGRQTLIDTIQQDFGIPINHYIEVNFKGFQGVVDAIGGVPMYFDEAMRDGNSGLNITAPGCVTLNGEQALAFARSRELQFKDPKTNKWRSDGTGDLGRITRQQVFIRKVIDRSASKATSLDLAGTNSLLDAGVKNLTVDSGFGIDTMLALGKEFKDFTGDLMVSHTLPTTPFTTSGGAEVLRLDKVGAQPIFDLFKGADATPQAKPSDVTLAVRNSSGVTGAAAKAQVALQSLGFTVSGTDTGTVSTHTSVQFGSGGQDQANLVARHVKGGADVTENTTLADGEIQLVMGKDYVSIIDDNAKTVTGATSATTGKGSAATTTTAPSNTITDNIGETPGVPPDGVTCG